MVARWGSVVVFGDKKSTASVKGVEPDYAQVEQPNLYYGRYINPMDMAQHRKVCVLGKKIYKTLFPGGGNPCGQLVRIDSLYYSVVGVDYSSGNMNINGSAEESVILPITLMQQTYNLGDQVDIISLTGRPGVVLSKLSSRIRGIIAHEHHVDPTDEKGITVFNTEVLFGMVDSLFKGVNYLVWLVGIGTLLAGAIGVSNIMMVTVRERTDGIVQAHFQVSFWTAVGAMALLSVLGVLAGLAPAARAMSIKPVDAMRDE